MSSEPVDYRHLYREDELVGIVGQGSNSNKIFVRGTTPYDDKILKSLVGPVKEESAIEIGDVVISGSRIVQIDDPAWIVHIEYSLPYDLYATPISRTTESAFKGFDLSAIKRRGA